MFCPTCGKDNASDPKFCASCGTNLEAVSQALTGYEDDFFTKMDAGFDQLIARYSEHVFRGAPQAASERKVSKSWQLLGKAVLTSMIDILLFILMWNLLPLRFLILVISTPFRLMAERSNQDRESRFVQAYKPPELAEPAPQMWLDDSAPSVIENTTRQLENRTPTGVQAPTKTARPK